MHIALFGGTFDPPHRGHQFITQQLLAHQTVEEVWLVPVKNHPFLRPMTAAVNRVEMVELMAAELGSKVKIERYEIDHPGASYSLQTLRALAQQYPQHTFSWVIGSDNLASFDQWHEYQELLQNFTVYVYPRQGFPARPLYPGMIFLTDFPEITISSTQVRQKAQQEESLIDVVSEPIANYIRHHHLYTTQV